MPPAIEAAAAAGIKIGVHPYEHDPDNQKYGLEAAEALGVPLAHVFKTLAIDIGATMTLDTHWWSRRFPEPSN